MHNPSFKPPSMAQVGPGAAFLMHATCGASWLLGTRLWALVDHAHAKFSFRMLEDTACNIATWHPVNLVAAIGATVRTLPTNSESNAQGSRPLELHNSGPEDMWPTQQPWLCLGLQGHTPLQMTSAWCLRSLLQEPAGLGRIANPADQLQVTGTPGPHSACATGGLAHL